MGFSAVAMAGSTRVGNALGAGSAEGARLAALSSALMAPAIWAVVAAVLTWPVTQNLLLSLFTTGADELLLQRMRSLLYLVVLLELFDGAQTILSGIIAGVGKQRRGSAINVVAYWACAVGGRRCRLAGLPRPRGSGGRQAPLLGPPLSA